MRIALWTIVLVINCMVWGITILEELIPYVIKTTNGRAILNFVVFSVITTIVCYAVSVLFNSRKNKKLAAVLGCLLLIACSVASKVFDDLSQVMGILFGGLVSVIVLLIINTRILRGIKSISNTYGLSRSKHIAFSNYLRDLSELVKAKRAKLIYVEIYGYVIRLSDMPLVTEAFKDVFDRKFNAAQILCKKITDEAQKRDKSDPCDKDLISLLQALVNCEGMLQNDPLQILPVSMRDELKIQHMVADAIVDARMPDGSTSKSKEARNVLAAMIGEGTRASVKNNADSTYTKDETNTGRYELMVARLDSHGLLLLGQMQMHLKQVIMPFFCLFVLCLSLVAMLSDAVVKFFIGYFGGAAQASTILQGYNIWMLCFMIVTLLTLSLCFLYTGKRSYPGKEALTNNGSHRAYYLIVRVIAFLIGFAILIMPGQLIPSYINLREDMAQLQSKQLICNEVMITSTRMESFGAVFILSPKGILDKMRVMILTDPKKPNIYLYVPRFFKTKFTQGDIYNRYKSFEYNRMVKPKYRACYTSNNRTLVRLQRLQPRKDSTSQSHGSSASTDMKHDHTTNRHGATI